MEKRFLPFLASFSTLALLEIFLYQPHFVYFILALVDYVLFYAAYKLTKDNLIDKRWWNLMILPIVFTDGLIGYSTLIPFRSFFGSIQLLFLFDIFFVYIYLRAVYFYLVFPTEDRKTSLENISSCGNFLSYFFISSLIFGLQSFVNASVWPLLLLIILASGVLVYQMIWASIDKIKENLIYIAVSCLILAELAGAIFYLPFNFNIMGLSLAIIYYVMTGLIRVRLRGTLNKRIIKVYLGVGIASIFIILLTARWV